MSNAEPVAVHPVARVAVDSLALTRGLLRRLVDVLSDEQMLSRTCPNGNHPLWCVGHIAVTEQFFLSHLGQGPRVLPESWDALFQFATSPSDDADVYPAPAEVVDGAETIRRRVVEWLASLDEAALDTPITGDLEPFARSFAHLGPSLVKHESFHAGQISAARRAMGLPPQF